METMTLLDLFALGGWAVWPLLAFSVVTISLIIERAIFIFYYNLKVRDIEKEILNQMETGNLEEAKKVCAAYNKRKLAAPIFSGALEVAGLGEHRVEMVFQSKSTQIINSLERGFDLLVALGSIAPITGFLGTVSGMIGAFQSIANAADINAQLVAGGIFEALITTAFGLAIAIVAITGFNVFTHIVDRFSARLEESANDFIVCLAKSR